MGVKTQPQETDMSFNYTSLYTPRKMEQCYYIIYYALLVEKTYIQNNLFTILIIIVSI